MLEMASQPECYEGRSWESEIERISRRSRDAVRRAARPERRLRAADRRPVAAAVAGTPPGARDRRDARGRRRRALACRHGRGLAATCARRPSARRDRRRRGPGHADGDRPIDGAGGATRAAIRPSSGRAAGLDRAAGLQPSPLPARGDRQRARANLPRLRARDRERRLDRRDHGVSRRARRPADRRRPPGEPPLARRAQHRLRARARRAPHLGVGRQPLRAALPGGAWSARSTVIPTPASRTPPSRGSTTRAASPGSTATRRCRSARS